MMVGFPRLFCLPGLGAASLQPRSLAGIMHAMPPIRPFDIMPAAHRLLRRLVDIARWHMADRVFLEVRPSNPGAIKLYFDEGFNEIGRRPNYYPAAKGREDAIVMAKELLPPED